MLVCECGKIFNSDKGINAHQFYCDVHVNSLPEDEKLIILQRKAAKQEVKNKKHADKVAAFMALGRKCALCDKPITNITGNTIYCSKRCSSTANYRARSPETVQNAIELNRVAHLQIYAKKRAERDKQFADERHACEQCGKIMDHKFGSGRFCSKQCSDTYCAEYSRMHRQEASERTSERWKDPEMRSKIIAGQQKAIDQGRWPGMMMSNKPSYAEEYWMAVLTAQNIRYEYNYLVKHSDIGVVANKLTWYKLDFYLTDYNVDLEIDGSQHLQQAEHDRLRDSRLTNGGYIVYRIPWKGYHLVSLQLAELLAYLSQLQNR